MAVLTTYLVKLISESDSVPDYLKETLPSMYKPTNLLIQMDEDFDTKVQAPSEEKPVAETAEEEKVDEPEVLKPESPKAKEDDSDSFEVLEKEETAN